MEYKIFASQNDGRLRIFRLGSDPHVGESCFLEFSHLRLTDYERKIRKLGYEKWNEIFFHHRILRDIGIERNF